MKSWNEAKAEVANGLGVAPDLLHVPVGVLIFLGAAILLRRRQNALAKGFGILVIVQLLNEVVDGIQWIFWTGTVHWDEALRDTGLTLALPLALIMSAASLRSMHVKQK